MTMNKIEIIEFPVFCHYVVHVEITDDIKEAFAKYPQTKFLNPEEYVEGDGLTISVKNEPFSFIFLKPTATVNHIAHESWHAVSRMMRYIGAELENEIVAYHLGYLSEKIWDLVSHVD